MFREKEEHYLPNTRFRTHRSLEIIWRDDKAVLLREHFTSRHPDNAGCYIIECLSAAGVPINDPPSSV